jgi:hypothetical protein
MDENEELGEPVLVWGFPREEFKVTDHKHEVEYYPRDMRYTRARVSVEFIIEHAGPLNLNRFIRESSAYYKFSDAGKIIDAKMVETTSLGDAFGE